MRTFENLNNIKKVHLIGIGGVSMSAIAIVLKKAGFIVTGSDKSDGDMIQILKDNDIPVYIGSNADLVKNVDTVVYTSAINQHDPEYVKAKSLNIPCYERAKFLGLLLKSYKTPICICGTHGKTTTTSMISSIFIDNNLDPNIQVGSKYAKLNNSNYRIGDSEYFILESCEYVDSFLNFSHDTATVLNIDEDHLDYFSGIEEIKKSFKKFILMTNENGNVIMNLDDKNSMDVLDEIKNKLKEKHIKIYTFSLKNENADVYAKNLKCDKKGHYTFDVIYKDKKETFSLNVPGVHNVYDAVAAITTSLAHNINLEDMVTPLKEFCGARRRFELKKELDNNVFVYDDYAHHPTEIKATLKAAKSQEHNRIIAIFQPHTYSRTKELLDEFSKAFFDADIAIITDIYAAREIDDGTISSKDLVEKLKENNVNAIYISSFDDIVDYIHKNVEPNDIVITVGAGSVTKISDKL